MTQQRNIQKQLDAQKAGYAKEAAARWGKTDAYAESLKRQAARTAADNSAMQQDADDIFAAFAANMDKAPDSPKAQALVQRWLDHISRFYYPCTKQILAGLGKMCVADKRFTEAIAVFCM